MSRLLAWLDEKPAEAPAPPAVPPPPTSRLEWPGGARTSEVRSLVRGLELALGPAVFEEGDAADRALAMVRAWREAIDHNPRHGLNWFRKHRDELEALIRIALPELLGPPPPALEGAALVDCALRVFPGAFRGPVQAMFPPQPQPWLYWNAYRGPSQ